MQHLKLVANTEAQAQALKACLEYLYEEALKADLEITANLIGAAAESLNCGPSAKKTDKGFHVVIGHTD